MPKRPTALRVLPPVARAPAPVADAAPNQTPTDPVSPTSRPPLSVQEREKHAQIVLNLLHEATAGKAATQEAICSAARQHLVELIHG